MSMKKLLEFLGLRPKPTAAMKQLTAAQESLARTQDPRMRVALQRDIDELSVEDAFDGVVARDAQGAAIGRARDDLRKLGEMLGNAGNAPLDPAIAVQADRDRDPP